ncbi:hypothetical protein T07_12815 [Trichinella nelsoni]|uniref:Uncharacterized protein n=1 Tax=Trichinella nelsoni TaxID=6336 RepID=A0A0V0RG80_9BILA|nr:hypothetical protein T07_12815 [Trichinella nelsoni]
MARVAGSTARNGLDRRSAARIAQERRAALIQYHTDAEVWDVMRAMHVQETVDFDGLKLKPLGCAVKASWRFRNAFPVLSGATDKNLLQQFKGGLSADAVKTAVLQNGTDSFAKAIEVAAQEERVGRELTMLKASVHSAMKTDVDQEDNQPAVKVTEATAAAVATLKEAGENLAEEVRKLKELLTGSIPAAAKISLP